MITDNDMRTNYLAALRDAKAELTGLQDRRRALEATVAALSRLVDGESQLSLGADMPGDVGGGNGRRPSVPPGFFADKTPTEAYRDLQKLWPGEYTGVEVRDAFLAGGMKAKSKNALLAQVHSVRRRERVRAQKATESGIGQ